MTTAHLIPMLPVANLSASIDFYRRLGFEVEQRNDDWHWAALRLGECRLMLDQSINVHPHVPRDAVLYLYPDDIHAYHAKLRANGFDAPPLETTFYGMIEFRIDDPDGNRWWIGQSTDAPADQPVF